MRTTLPDTLKTRHLICQWRDRLLPFLLLFLFPKETLKESEKTRRKMTMPTTWQDILTAAFHGMFALLVFLCANKKRKHSSGWKSRSWTLRHFNISFDRPKDMILCVEWGICSERVAREKAVGLHRNFR